MPTINRTLSAIDILREEMAEQLANTDAGDEPDSTYLASLKQLIRQLKQLLSELQSFSEREVTEITLKSACPHISSRKLLNIHIKLLTCILDYYSASAKADVLAGEEYSLASDERLTLFQNKAGKARATFKTIARPLGKKEYAKFLTSYSLPQSDWSISGFD